MKIITSKLLNSFSYQFNYMEKLAQLNRAKVEALSRKYKIHFLYVEDIAQYDPTPNKQYLDWLTKQFVLSNLVFPEDGEKCIHTLSSFIQKRQVLKNNHLPVDINKYKTLGEIQKKLDEVSGINTKRHQVKVNTEHGQRVVIDQPPYKVVEITTPEAAAKLCRDTEWCIKDPKYFNGYEMGPNNPVYLILKNGVKYGLLHNQTNQFRDVYDNALDLKDYKNTEILMMLHDAGINVKTFALKLLKSMDIYENEKLFILKAIPKEEIINSPEMSYFYARNILDGRFPEGEPAIMTDFHYLFHYAYNVIQGRWPEAEPIVLKDFRNAFEYAQHIIKGRWPELENILLNNIDSINHEHDVAEHMIIAYANTIIRGPWPEAEHIILKDAVWCYDYAKNALKHRWPEAEPVIATSPFISYYYAYYIIHGRWPEAEPVIMIQPEPAYLYALNVIKGRWPEAEEYIKKDTLIATKYFRTFLSHDELYQLNIHPYDVKKQTFENKYFVDR